VNPALPVAVIGAGAAGLMAAIHAAGTGRRVVLLERTRDGGRKILISGGGRCNVLPGRLDAARFVSESPPHLVRRLLAEWPLARQRDFFEERLGIPLALEADSGKLFPASNRARDVRDRLSRANETVVRIRAIKAQVGGKGETARDRDVTRAEASLSNRLTEIEGELYQYRNQSSQDPLNYPIRLNNRIGALMGVVESADARPTDQSYAVFKELSSRLDAELARLDALLATDVPGFNTLLARRKIAPLAVEEKR